MAEYIMTRTWICHMPEFTIINTYYTIHSVSLMSNYWQICVPGQRSKMECFGKIIIVLIIFAKNSLNIWEGSKYVSSFKYVRLWIFVNFRKYGRVMKMRWDAIMKGFWIFQDSKYLCKIWLKDGHNQELPFKNQDTFFDFQKGKGKSSLFP